MGSLGSSSQYSTSHGTPNSSLKHEANFASMPSNQLQPTWIGYVADTSDALVLFQGAIDGTLRKVVRRPHDRERPEVIRSGAVFIYEESASGIKRWTDGVPWSPSRILGNFLIYRELEKPFPPGEKKRATKKIKSPRPGAPYPSRGLKHYDPVNGLGIADSSGGGDSQVTSSTQHSTAQSQISTTPPPVKQESPNSERESERSLVGSLTDSYAFKQDGLVKKTLSINHQGGHLHLVSYYNPEQVKQSGLTMIADDPVLSAIQVQPELIQQQNFRSPIEGADDTASVTTSSSSYRSSLPSQFIGGSSSSSSYMNTPQYHLPQQSVAHPPSTFYSSMSAAYHSGYQLPPSYGQPPYTDFSRSLPPTSSSSVTSLGHYQTLPPNSQMPVHPMHPDQSSYMQQSSYQMQDGRSHHSEHYSGHFKPEWHDGHQR